MADDVAQDQGCRQLRLALEARAKQVKDRLLAKSREGDLDILTFLELAAERFSVDQVASQLAHSSQGNTDFIILQAYLRRVVSFKNQLEAYFVSAPLQHCLSLAISSEVDREAFQRVKADWKQFRHTYLADVRLHDPHLADVFVLLECVARCLLIHHEQQASDQVRKNLKLVDHLIVKHDLNSALRRLQPAVTLMHRLGDTYGNLGLKNRLKEEGRVSPPVQRPEDPRPWPANKNLIVGQPPILTPASHRPAPASEAKTVGWSLHKNNLETSTGLVTVELFPVESQTRKEVLQARFTTGHSLATSPVKAGQIPVEPAGPTWPEATHLDASFLSDKSESSISFMDPDDRRPTRCLADSSPGHGTISKGSPRPKNDIKPLSWRDKVIETDVRDLTREQIEARLKPIIGEQRSIPVSRNLEARLFGTYFCNEAAYDSSYSKVVSFLEMLPRCPSLVAPLLDCHFDLDFILAKADALQPAAPDRASLDKATQTFLFADKRETFSRVASLGSLDKSSTTAGQPPPDLESRLANQLRTDETSYLQRLVLQTRQENEFLRRAVFELRLNLGTSPEDKNSLL
jgi:hypothetical protein